MSLSVVQRVTGGLLRRFGWMPEIITVACLIVGACVATSSPPEKSDPDQRPQLSAETAAGIPAGPLKFIPTTGSRAELHGTTNIGPWTSQSTDIRGQLVLNIDENALDALFDRIQIAVPDNKSDTQPSLPDFSIHGKPVVHISVPVDSFHSNKSGMDRDMRKALKAAENPLIEYVYQQLQHATVQRNSRNGQAGLKLRIVGTLNMAGAGRPITMDVIVNRDRRRHFSAYAQTALSMSDFGVSPPVALLGLIKAGNGVQVTFDLDLVMMPDSAGVAPPTNASRK